MEHQARENVEQTFAQGQGWRNWMRNPRGGALIAALIVLIVLLPLWYLAVGWYRTQLLSEEPLQQPLFVFELGGLVVLALLASLAYLSINRQARLARAVQRRTLELTCINQQLQVDIARRKQVEEELRRSDERYRALAHSFPNGAVFMFDHDLRYTLADGAGLGEVGLSKEMLEGMTIWEVLPPDTVDVIEPHYRAALAGEAHAFEVSFGGQMYLAHALPLRNEQGAIFAGMVVTQNVTERKRAEESLAKWAHIFEHAEWGVVVGRADSRLDTMNPAYARMHGFTVEELAGQPIASVFAPDAADELSELIRIANETGHAVIESRHVHKDGSIFPVLVDLTAVKDDAGRLLYRVANVQDITERKRAEEDLLTSEARFRSAFDDAAIGMALVAPDGAYLRVNRAYCELIGYTEAELLNNHFQSITHPDDVAADVDGLLRLLAGAIHYYELEKRFIHKRGHIVWALLSVSLVKDARGQPLYTVSQTQDITQRKQAEAALREKEAQYRAVFEATTDGLVIRDMAGSIVEANPAFCQMHGYTREELIGRQITTVIHPDHHQIVQDSVQAIRQTGYFHAQSMSLRKDGSAFHVEARGSTFTYKGQPHVLAVVRDVSTQVEAEQLLEQRVEERTHELSTLLDISRNVASTLELTPLLGLILDQVKTLMDYDGAVLLKLQDNAFVVLDYRGPIPKEQALQGRFPLERSPLDREIVRRREPIIIGDIRDDSALAQSFLESAGDYMQHFGHIRSWLGVPLLIKDEMIGMLALDHGHPQHFTEQHARLAIAIANQAAIAIENARLFAEAQGKAILEERQRLARDLHDSVTQSLYSSTLLAEAGRQLAETGDVRQAGIYLGEIVEITQQSLKEMRLLVYQLRPFALEREGLIGALQGRLDSVEKRAGIDARFVIDGDVGRLSPTLEEGLFRIAQEALNNALKHAAARSVLVRLHGDDECVTLEISDDGRGFDRDTASVHGGLGLIGIEERVTQLRGILTVRSSPGRGTYVSVQAPRRTY